jgi:hypothetical protein
MFFPSISRHYSKELLSTRPCPMFCVTHQKIFLAKRFAPSISKTANELHAVDKKKKRKEWKYIQCVNPDIIGTK